MTTLEKWLDRYSLGKYAELLARHEVDLDVLPELDESDLESIGLPLGARKKLLRSARELGQSQDMDQVQEQGQPRPPSGEAERRQLTVMFADLVGSTALSQELDPEDLRDVNRAYQDVATEAINRFGGFVARYMGDGVLAYFGYPRAHENDAERAVRAGLELIDSVSALEMGIELAVRLGIATGPVVVGDIVGTGAAQESAVVGETPNLAARLQGVAAPNTVVISAATRQLIGGRFELKALGAHSLKGIRHPVQAYRAVSVRDVSRFDAAHEHRLTPVVGREEELGLLRQRWKLATQGEGQVVLLAGEAGVGKSRIVHALRDILADASSERISLYCSPYHQSSAFQPVIEQLERAAGIDPTQAAAEKMEALGALLNRLGLRDKDSGRLFAALLSVPHEDVYTAPDMTPEQLRRRTLDVLVATVGSMAARAPVLFIVEDAHWIDPSTQDYLTQLIGSVRTSRVLVVITHRPEYQLQRSGHPNVTAIALSNLGRQDSAAMIAEVTKGRNLPASLVDDILVRADGVPLFIEEMAVALSSSTMDSDGNKIPTFDPTTADIPATLQDLLMERLDRLASSKETAQLGAVIGRSFSFDLLRAVCNQNEKSLEQNLTCLLQSGLIYERGGAARSYEFKHALVRDAAYQSLLNRERKSCHERIARALLHAHRDNPPLELLGYHFYEGGHPGEAAQYWRQAGERALGRFAHVEAISDFRCALQAVELLPENDNRLETELEIQTLLGPSLMFVMGQGASEVEHTYARALALGEQLKDSGASFAPAWGIWRLNFARGDMKSARDYASTCQRISADSTDPVAKLGTAFAVGATCLFSGQYSAAAPHLEECIRLYRKLEDKSGLARFGQDPGLSSLSYLAWGRWMLGFPDQALSPCEESVQLAREIGKPVFIAITTGFAALTYSMRRDTAKVAEYAQECLSICDRHEFRQWSAMSKVLLGYAHSHQGDHERAAALAEDGLNEKVVLHSYIACPCFCCLAAEINLAAGRMPEALEVARRGLAFADRGGERFYEPDLHRVLALTLAKSPGSTRDDIEKHFNCALDLAGEQSAKSFELRSALEYSRFLYEHGAQGRAVELLSPIYEWFTEGFDNPELLEAKTLLGELS